MESNNGTWRRTQRYCRAGTENGGVAIFEVKLAGTLEQMESKSVEAVGQIENRMYAKDFKDDYDQILCYGIAFFRKRGLVKRKQI